MENNGQNKANPQSNRTASSKQKFVVGTACTATLGRKMRTPPADIFVWGVHPDTTIDDIVNDLAASDIRIEAKDVEKKSKNDAPRNSYKISVAATDLKKALDPSIWPIRVKAREYIYYSKKRNSQEPSKETLNKAAETSVTPTVVTANAHDHSTTTAQLHEHQVNLDITTSNRYDPLANGNVANQNL